MKKVFILIAALAALLSVINVFAAEDGGKQDVNAD